LAKLVNRYSGRFYLADSRRVDLVRLLHGRRDIHAELIEVHPG
jgi:plasmid stabilization system protein ParE